MYHDSKNNAGVTYPAILKPDETFVVPDKFLGKVHVFLKLLLLLNVNSAKRFVWSGFGRAGVLLSQ